MAGGRPPRGGKGGGLWLCEAGGRLGVSICRLVQSVGCAVGRLVKLSDVILGVRRCSGAEVE